MYTSEQLSFLNNIQQTNMKNRKKTRYGTIDMEQCDHQSQMMFIKATAVIFYPVVRHH